jgi:plasmid stabilization system protein ParE
MTIIRSTNYVDKLDVILDFIAQDSFTRTEDFLNKLDHKINSIPNFPYKHRKSIHHKDENVRDLIFNGYTISYFIEDEQIIILDIFKWINKN